jgi:hypothetical protein
MPKQSKRRGILFYNTYYFRGQDPAVERVLALQKNLKVTDRDACSDSRLSRTTVTNWRSRKVRRPQHASLTAHLRALGKDWGPFVDWDKDDK